MPDYTLYPVFMDLSHRPVLIVGGGGVALRKVTGVLETGARITVVSTDFCPELESLNLTRIAQEYSPEHMNISPWRLVFAATNIPAVNEAVARDAADRGILCCRCDDPSAGDFVGGAAGAKGAITIAVSTGKASPVLAARIRDQALAGIDPLLVTWTHLLSVWRTQVLSQVKNEPARRALLRRIAGAEMEAVLRRQGAGVAQDQFAAWLKESQYANTVSKPSRPRGGSHAG